IATPTPITTVVAALRLTVAAKGKQPARATSPTDPSEIERTEGEQLKIATESGEGDDEETESDGESEDEETREQEEESFDPIPRTPKDDEDDGNDEEDQGLRISDEERMHEEEKADELYRDMLIVVPFHNLEIGDSDDPPLGVDIESRFLVNSEPVELLTFPPSDKLPKGRACHSLAAPVSAQYEAPSLQST
nr:hypothetical protein [Tanacetum cinerariifolium]